MWNLTPLSEAIQLAGEQFGSLCTGQEFVSLEGALNRVLAENIHADEFVPVFNRSTVDGYAVKSGDVEGCSMEKPVHLKLVGESIMGRHTDFNLRSGESAVIPTGGEVPEGADAVVMLEDTALLDDGWVAINKPVAAGENIIMRGEDTRPGDVVLPIGRRINAADSGTLAALGVTRIPVMRKPRVAIISSGDELIPPDGKPQPGQIRDVNSPILFNAVLETGAEPHVLDFLPDDEEVTTRVLKKAAAEFDIVLLTGGTSVGEKDAMPRVIGKLGRLLLHGITVKPGKPTLFGEIDGVPVFGLPGNPVAVYFIFYNLVRPILFSMQGTESINHRVTLPAAQAFPADTQREKIVPVRLREGFVLPLPSKSGLITTLAATDGFIRIPAGQVGLQEGDLVEVTLFTR
jgi:molybdopterin molybdotransferase